MQLKPADEIIITEQPVIIKIIAKVFSYVFHPLFIPTYIFLWLTNRFPLEFAGITPFGLFARKFTVFWMTAFFPAFATFLLWRLKFINNIYLRTQKERIIPYVITMIFYWWMWYLSRNFSDQPGVLRVFFLGIFFSTVIGLISNNFIKTSMHAMGAGGALSFILLTCFVYHSYLGADIMFAILLTGIVCTARLLLSTHSQRELYGGLLAGIFCQLLAFIFY